jgi:hypothetical protein
VRGTYVVNLLVGFEIDPAIIRKAARRKSDNVRPCAVTSAQQSEQFNQPSLALACTQFTLGFELSRWGPLESGTSANPNLRGRLHSGVRWLLLSKSEVRVFKSGALLQQAN